MTSSVAQLWCPRCLQEVIARIATPPGATPAHATCPWCETTILIPEEAQA